MGYTQIYSVSQTSCQYCGNPNNSSTFDGLGTSSNANGVAYGEAASVANGLTGQVINKITIPNLISTTNTWNSGTNAGTGTMGVQIRNSAGTLQYTFTGANATITLTGLSQTAMCNVDGINSAFAFSDDSNTYVMQTGDVVLITWSGTGSNNLAIPNNTGGTYGVGKFWTGSAFTTDTGNDFAGTIYTGSAPPPITLYLHAATFTGSGTFPNSTGTLQGGTSSGPKNPSQSGADSPTLNRSMDTNIGSSQHSIGITTLASTATENYYFGKFISPPLPTAQTVSAATWTYNHAIAESNTNANMPCAALYLYVWRPSTGALVAFICNTASGAGNAEPTAANTEKLELTTWTGSSVSCNAGDVLILEVWTHVTQSASAAYTDTFYFDGTTATSTGTSGSTTVSSMASYISADAGIEFSQLYTYSLADTVSISDSLVRKLKRRKTLAETVTLTETRKKKAIHKKADTLSIVESEAKIRRVPRTQTDILSIVDPVQKLVNHKLAQATGAITDSLKKRAVHLLADTPSIVDTIKKKATHKIAEAIGSVTDSLGRFKKGIKTFTDSSPITVSFEKRKNANPQLALDDEIPITDAVTKYSTKKAFAESLGAIVQQTTPTKGRALPQSLGAITDSMKKKATHVLSDTLGISDALQKMYLGRPHLTESLGAISDSLLKHHRFLRAMAELMRTVRSG